MLFRLKTPPFACKPFHLKSPCGSEITETDCMGFKIANPAGVFILNPYTWELRVPPQHGYSKGMRVENTKPHSLSPETDPLYSTNLSRED